MYDFNKIIDRKNSSSIKWDFQKEYTGVSDEMIPLWVADMDFEVPQEVTNALKERVNHPIYGYTGKPKEYYDAIINWFHKRHGFEIKKEWIVYSPGVVTSLNLAIQEFSNPGDKIIIQSPVYYPFKLAIENNGRQCIENSLKKKNNKYYMDIDDLKSKIDSNTKVMLLCSPHNPVSRVWSKEELQQIANICLENNILLVSDEIHADLVMPGFKHTSIGIINEEIKNNCIICHAPNKTFNIAGLSMGNIIIPNKRIREQYTFAMGKVGIGMANIFGITAAQAAYNDGEKWLDEIIEYIYNNYKYAKQFLEENLPGIKITELEGTYLMWVDFSKLDFTHNEINLKLMKEAKVWLNDGSKFGKEGIKHQRINLACPRQILSKALENIVKVFK